MANDVLGILIGAEIDLESLAASALSVPRSHSLTWSIWKMGDAAFSIAV